jgi:hypothetical protein
MGEFSIAKKAKKKAVSFLLRIEKLTAIIYVLR